jgi:hypothetical protein
MGRLAGIHQPTLLLHGEGDVLVPVAAARRMAASHPAWRLEIAPGIGHIPMLEAPRWTAEAIRAWLSAEGAPAARLSSTGPVTVGPSAATGRAAVDSTDASDGMAGDSAAALDRVAGDLAT